MKGRYESGAGDWWEDSPMCGMCKEPATLVAPFSGVLLCDNPECAAAYIAGEWDKLC